MNIVLGNTALDDINSKYVVLELDTFKVSPEKSPVTAYAIIETIPLEELSKVQEYQALHQSLIENYRHKHWEYCNEVIGHLKGRWSGELDTFYDDLLKRIDLLKSCTLPDNWDGSVAKGI
jgi:hypothetical protein